jgi:hypothetical protein
VEKVPAGRALRQLHDFAPDCTRRGKMSRCFVAFGHGQLCELWKTFTG